MIMTETLEEAAREYYKRGQLGFEKASDTERAFLEGAKWQQEISYSEEEAYNIVQDLKLKLKSGIAKWQDDFEFDLEEWFEQFKKK